MNTSKNQRVRPLALVFAMIVAGLAVPPVLAVEMPPSSTQNAAEESWTISGDDAAAPLQVLKKSDGVYVQLKSLNRVPAIYADTPGGPTLQHWHVQGPWIVVNSSAWHLIFKLGDRTATAAPPEIDPIASISASPIADAPTVAAVIPATASATHATVASTAHPVAASAAIAAMPGTPRSEVPKHIPDTHTPAAVAPTSAAAPIPPHAPVPVLVESAVASAPVDGQTLTFSVSAHDIDLHAALERWLANQGWQLAWSISDALPLEYNATFSGPDMKSVLEKVMRATSHMSTPARICRHIPNNVVRVVARAVSCKE